MRSILTLTFLTLLASCSGKVAPSTKLKISSYIYGGERVVEGKWRSVVSISKINYQGELTNSFCTGTLIDKRTVLSAAHCFSRSSVYYEKSAAITFDNEDSKERSLTRIKGVKVHPEYKGEDSTYDFAIIELEQDVELDSAEIISPSHISSVEVGKSVDLVGFGKIEDGSNGVKFEVQTKVREDQDVEFIAGGEGRDTCSGDSGGPVFIKNESGKYEFFGVTSRTPDDATSFCGDKTIYGKVSEAMKWVNSERLIEEAVESNSLKSIEILNKAKEIYPKYFKVYSLLGEFYLKFNMLDQAVESLIAANTLNLEDEKTLNLLRQAYERKGDIDSEVVLLRRLLILNPSNESYFKRLDFFGETALAQISRGIGRFKRGDTALAKIDLELNRDDPSAAYILAFSLFLEQDYKSALEELRAISSDAILVVDLTDRRGDTFIMSSTFEGQIEIVNELLKFKPNLMGRDSYGNNLAEIAWWAREFELIKVFTSLGVEWDVNEYSEQFISLIRSQMIEEVRFMLDMGFDLSFVGPRGETAINLARETNNQELIELVESYGKEKSFK